MNVTTVSGYSNNLDDKIHLNNKFLSKIRFILATEFDKLFSEKEDSLIKLADNKIVLKLKDFEYSLKERLNVLSNFVQEKGQNSVLKLISDKNVLDIITFNEKPMAILDKVDKEKNVEIPFDLFFCDFTKQIKYGAVILNKKDHNKRIFKESKFFINIKMNSNILFENLGKLLEKSLFLSQKIRLRYFCIVWLIYFGMREVENNSKSSLTRTGKVYKTFDDGRLCYNDNSKYSENISVQIKETETKTQIDSNIPVAIVELIEEVKIEREKLKEMNKKEFKKRWNEYIIGEVNYKHNKELKERLEEVKNEQKTILKEDLKELNIRKEQIVKEINECEIKRNNLNLSKKLKQKVEKREELLEEIRDIKLGNNKERKGKFRKITEMILKRKFKRNQKEIRKRSKKFNYKYGIERFRNSFEMLNEEYDSEDLNKEIEENNIFLDELQELDEKYPNGEIGKIKTEEGKKLKKSLKLYKDYKKIEEIIKQLENKRDNLEVSKNLKNKINEKEEIMEKIKEIEDNNYKEKNEKLDKIRKEQEKILEEKLEKIKFENDKIVKGDLEGEGNKC
uniref:Uncharacterized protein n=2 Tax=Meloidogyne enterolobii TaxID=390850 RepID=A0A6V7Y5X7_MELEN|nr:unnamed protein product [Meloidogyne enterolobii]